LERDLENYNPLFSESLQKPLKKFIREGISRKLKDDVAKLEKLKLEIFDSRPDNDKVIELIESLRGNHIQKIQFEIIQEQVYLELRIDNSKAKLNFKTINEKELNQSLHRSTLNILKTIGFDNENELTISIRANTDSQKLLSILSIVIFEAFSYLELREMNLIVFA